jgi:hypothetical protein
MSTPIFSVFTLCAHSLDVWEGSLFPLDFSELIVDNSNLVYLADGGYRPVLIAHDIRSLIWRSVPV